MADETENLTIRLLREMRNDMQNMREEMHEMRDDLATRMDGITHIMTLLAGHSHDLEERVSKIEEQQT